MRRLACGFTFLSSDGVPIYLQIVNQVKYLVAVGRLAPGEELPPIRVLAEKLVVNPNTVARAYRELEAAGVVEKRRTAGTFVARGRVAAGAARAVEDLDRAGRCAPGRSAAVGHRRERAGRADRPRDQAMQPKRRGERHDRRVSEAVVADRRPYRDASAARPRSTRSA